MHVLLVTLIRLRCNTKQELLAAILKINQSNICRYIQFTKQGLIKILPTADTVAKAISQIKSTPDFKEIVPGRAGGEIKTDGTHVRVQRPEKNQGAMYSGKQKTHTYNVQITSNKKRLIIHVSGVYEGKRHDYGIFKNDIPLGGKSLKESTTPPSDKITVIDAGYEFTSSGILCTNHINCRDQLYVNLDTGELIRCRIPGDEKLYEFTSSGILCTNHINCRDQLCVNLDTGELIRKVSYPAQRS